MSKLEDYRMTQTVLETLQEAQVATANLYDALVHVRTLQIEVESIFYSAFSYPMTMLYMLSTQLEDLTHAEKKAAEATQMILTGT